MAHVTKNYSENGGAVEVVRGTLRVEGALVVDENATVTGLAANPLTAATADALGGVKIGDGLSVESDGTISVDNPLISAANQAASTADELAELVTDFNALLTKLKAAGIMVADS